jgi:cation transport ATPase
VLNKWFTSDNRRLWVFKKAEKLGIISYRDVYVTYDIDYSKFTTSSNGKYVIIRGNNPGVYLWQSLGRQMIEKQAKKQQMEIERQQRQRQQQMKIERQRRQREQQMEIERQWRQREQQMEIERQWRQRGQQMEIERQRRVREQQTEIERQRRQRGQQKEIERQRRVNTSLICLAIVVLLFLYWATRQLLSFRLDELYNVRKIDIYSARILSSGTIAGMQVIFINK